MMAAVAMASAERKEDGFGSRFYRQTLTDSEILLDFTSTIFDCETNQVLPEPG